MASQKSGPLMGGDPELSRERPGSRMARSRNYFANPGSDSLSQPLPHVHLSASACFGVIRSRNSQVLEPSGLKLELEKMQPAASQRTSEPS